MSTRNIAGVVERIRQLSFCDPSPDARAAYEVVLNLLGRVDECEIGELIQATAPRTLPALPQDWPLAPIVDVDLNQDADWRESGTEAIASGEM